MQNKRILILYAPLGAGHGSAAKAIAEAFAKNYPEFEVKTADVLDFAFEIFRQTLPKAFVFFSSRIPFLYKLIYNGFNHQKRYNFLNRASDVFIKKSHFVKFINEFDPDFILSTNPLPMQLVSLTKHKKIINILSANVCTDFGFHSLWYNSDVNYYFVANESIKEALIKHGVIENKVVVTGIPTSSKFNMPINDFKNSAPTLLIVGGKIKYPAVKKIIEKIQKKTSVHFIIVAGRDKNLLKNLQKSDLRNNKNIKVFGFVDNLQDYMALSDLILTKAGGLTVTECINMGLPMVLNDFIPGQEEDNVKYAVKNKVGLEAKNITEAAKIINSMFSDLDRIKKMKENCKRIARPNAAKDLADFVVKSL